MNSAKLSYRDITTMALTGMSPKQIAQSADIPTHQVYSALQYSRSLGVEIPGFKKGPKAGDAFLLADIVNELKPHAARRGLVVGELIQRLLQVIADEEMVDTILDDGETADV